METFSALMAICAGNSPVPGEFPAQSQWGGALMFCLIYARIGWVNTGEAGDLRHHRTHYDVIVMETLAVSLGARMGIRRHIFLSKADVSNSEHLCIIFAAQKGCLTNNRVTSYQGPHVAWGRWNDHLEPIKTTPMEWNTIEQGYWLTENLFEIEVNINMI